MKLLTNEEIRNILRKHSTSRDHKKPVFISQIAALCEMGRDDLNHRMTGRYNISEKDRLRLSTVLHAVESGSLKFKRGEPPVYVQKVPGVQDRMVIAGEWENKACRGCKSYHWQTAFKGDKELKVCGRCIPQSQYPALHLDTKLKGVYKRLTEK